MAGWQVIRRIAAISVYFTLLYSFREEGRQQPTDGCIVARARCRLNGSYESLQGGSTAEGMEDFTGGVTETINLQAADLPPDLFSVMCKAFDRKSLMGCSIDVSLLAYIHRALDILQLYSVYLIAILGSLTSDEMSGKMS